MVSKLPKIAVFSRQNFSFFQSTLIITSLLFTWKRVLEAVLSIMCYFYAVWGGAHVLISFVNHVITDDYVLKLY